MISLLLLIPLFILTTFPDGTQCDSSLWNHVYHPQRLQILDPCIQATGIITTIKAEPDGDYHIRVQLDDNYTNLLNQGNIDKQHGDLVVEPVCIHEVTQADAVDACLNYSSSLVIPPVGTHVIVTGSCVLDTNHGWNEIHPLSKITQYTPIPEFRDVTMIIISVAIITSIVITAKNNMRFKPKWN